jgi:hypothetical protein
MFKGVLMKYLWIIFIFALLGCDSDSSDIEETRQVNILTIDENGDPFNVDIINWSQDTFPEVIKKLTCEKNVLDCSERVFELDLTGNIHFEVNFHRTKGQYCTEYFSGEEFVEVNESTKEIPITVYYDAIACE